MPGDYSRKTFDALKHYSGVLMQQGRVQLDADWNEQVSIDNYRTLLQVRDTVGRCGVPKKDNGFRIVFPTDGSDLLIMPGCIYANGLMCELHSTAANALTISGQSDRLRLDHLHLDGVPLAQDQWVEVALPDGSVTNHVRIQSVDTANTEITLVPDVAEFQAAAQLTIRRLASYKVQPHYPQPDVNTFAVSPPASPPASPPLSPPASPPEIGDHLNVADGHYLVYLEAWQHEINFRDDPLIQETALGEADTATRLKTVWQVKLLPLSAPMGATVDCESALPEWAVVTAPTSGRLNARAQPVSGTVDPCDLPPSAGFRRLENQLYRVQVHSGGSRSTATFKWSRDNATVETSILRINGTILTVSDLGRDEVLGFAAGQWVEIVDDQSDLQGPPNALMQIDNVNPAVNEIVLKRSAAALSGGANLKLRRWDQTGAGATAAGVGMGTGWLPLEDGVEVTFSAGTYVSGDYWLIPARTATGEIEWPPYEVPNDAPLPQPPEGIRRHFCQLARITVVAGSVTAHDCRSLFPALTDLSAEDVSYDNQNCPSSGADTVQQVLDWLCSARDLRYHNKQLHGMGVVCGLKVICDADRNRIQVQNGYALDCEGGDIVVAQPLVYDIVSQAAQQNLLNANGDGEVCLSIAGGGQGGVTLSIERYQKQSYWDDVLEGTLIKDFYEECIMIPLTGLLQFFPTALSDQPPLPDKLKRLTGIINLFSQWVNSASGPYAYISSEEHDLLKSFYDFLVNLLQSETFCAMRDNDQPYPDYTLDPGLNGVIGPLFKLHHRLYWHPTRNIAYTCGWGNSIYVYDLDKLELVRSLVFPSSSNAAIQDLAISDDGDLMVAAAIVDNKDTLFATAAITADGSHTWGSPSTQCGIRFVTLALGSGPDSNVYGIATGQGLYRIDGIGTGSFAINLLRAANATGQMILSPGGGLALVTDNTGPGTAVFDQILVVNTTNGVLNQTIAVQGDTLGDDLMYHNNTLYITGDAAPGHAKTLRGFEIVGGTEVITPVDLLDDTITRLAAATAPDGNEFILVSIADRSKLVRIDLATHSLDTNFRIPAQVLPMDIAVSPDGQSGCVLNALVNTLTVIDFTTAFDPGFIPNYSDEPMLWNTPTVLSTYREDAIEAFSDLFKHVAQYALDCFCDKFLVDCPTCTTDDRVYLGCVDIRNHRVYHICNFTKRHYVKSFRTYGYWLSTFPILPIIKKAVGDACCQVLNP